MASPSLALPGVVFVGEDDRTRLVAHLGPAAGWMIPKGILGWSSEVSVVVRDALTDQVRRDAKVVLPEEQIPPARLPLTHQAALKSPLVAISGRLTQKLVDAGIRVHTIGADRLTSSFYYIAEGGGEDLVRVEGDLVAAVGSMLGERADNAAIERVLDGLVDRLLRSLSRDRVTELSLELAAALPRAAADGTGTVDIDLDAFEKELGALVGSSEKYVSFLEEIATKLAETNERRVDIPLYGDARKVSQGPFDLTVGEQKVALVTHDRWLATGPLTEPKRAASPAATAAPAVTAASTRTSDPGASTPKVPVAQATAALAASAQANKPVAAPLQPPRPASTPPPPIKEPEAEVVKSSPATTAAAPKPEPASVPEPAVAAAASPVEPAVAAATSSVEPAVAAAQPGERDVKAEPSVESTSKTATLEANAIEGKKGLEAKAENVSKPSESEKPSSKAERSSLEARKPRERDSAIEKPKTQEKGFPWLWILILAAAAFAGYKLLIASH